LHVLLHGFDGLFRGRWHAPFDALAAVEGEEAPDRCVSERHEKRRQREIHRLVQQREDQRRQRAQRKQPGHGGAAEHAGAFARDLSLCAQLGFGKLDLLADQGRGLLGELLDQLAGRLRP